MGSPQCGPSRTVTWEGAGSRHQVFGSRAFLEAWSGPGHRCARSWPGGRVPRDCASQVPPESLSHYRMTATALLRCLSPLFDRVTFCDFGDRCALHLKPPVTVTPGGGAREDTRRACLCSCNLTCIEKEVCSVPRSQVPFGNAEQKVTKLEVNYSVSSLGL